MSEPKRTDYMFRTPSTRERDAEPARMRAEAIAMRRIVVEMGHWLSPLLRDLPLPVLSPYERTVDLSKLDHNSKHREDRVKREAARTGSRGASSTRRSEYRSETYAELQARMHSQRSKRKPEAALPTEADLNAAEAQRCLERRRRKKEQGSSDDTAQRATAIAAISRQAQSISDAERKQIAIERIAAVAAEKARIAAERKALTPEQRAERRKETAKRAGQAYTDRIKADPARHAEFVAKRRERERKRDAERAAFAAAPAAAPAVAPPVIGAQTRIANPHRDPTLPTARELRDEAIRAEAIERTQREQKALAAAEAKLHRKLLRIMETERRKFAIRPND